jgi:hypothetical protein
MEETQQGLPMPATNSIDTVRKRVIDWSDHAVGTLWVE